MRERKLHKVKLHGLLKEKYGKEVIEVYALTTREIFQNLCNRFGHNFRQTIMDGYWHITKGSKKGKKLTKKDKFLQNTEIDMPLLEEELHVFPAIAGAGGKAGSIVQIIVGVLLIIAGILLIIQNPSNPLGYALVISGIASVAGGTMALLAKPPSLNKYENASGTDPRASFLFNGTINNTEQGVPVPLVYGEFLTGSTVISAGLETIQIDIDPEADD